MKREVRLNKKVIGILDDKANNLAYFHSATPESPFSNMYQSPNGFDLYYKNGQMSANKSKNAKVYHFNCVEQVFSFGKALAMHDKETAKKIYQTKTYPAGYKKLGRSVKNFDGQKWNQQASNWMKLGMEAKFSQDPFAKKALEICKDYNLVEANPYDKKWGIGKAIDKDFSYYFGQNLQGQNLTQVKNKLFNLPEKEMQQMRQNMSQTRVNGNKVNYTKQRQKLSEQANISTNRRVNDNYNSQTPFGNLKTQFVKPKAGPKQSKVNNHQTPFALINQAPSSHKNNKEEQFY